MTDKDLGSINRLKNKTWLPAFKKYYDAKDFVRFFKEDKKYGLETRRLPVGIKKLPIEKLFKKKIIKEGMKLIEAENLSLLKRELAYLKEKRIPKLEAKIEKYTKRT